MYRKPRNFASVLEKDIHMAGTWHMPCAACFHHLYCSRTSTRWNSLVLLLGIYPAHTTSVSKLDQKVDRHRSSTPTSLKACLVEALPRTLTYHHICNVRMHELSVQYVCVLYGSHEVIPLPAWLMLIDLLHEAAFMKCLTRTCGSKAWLGRWSTS